MIRIDLTDDFGPALDQLDAALGDKSQLMDQIGDYMAGSSRDRIDAGVTPEGAPFAPRSQVTLDRYAKLGLGYKGPLWQSGDMSAGIFHEYGEDFAEWGSNAIQAAVMQFGAAQGAFGRNARGGPIPWGNIPARPFIGVSEADEEAVRLIVEDWLAAATPDAE